MSSDPRYFTLLVWRNLTWVRETGGIPPKRWSAEMRFSGKKIEYKLNGTVRNVQGEIFNVYIKPVTKTGRPEWGCGCESRSFRRGEQARPCLHAAALAQEWLLTVESLPKQRKLINWIKEQEQLALRENGNVH